MEIEKKTIEDNWDEYCRKFPLICGIKTLNAELTIYAVLQQACHQFDYVVISDDGSTDGTLEMIQKFLKDYDTKNVVAIDVSKYDPWPDQKIEKREGDHHVIRPAGQTHAKAQCKSYEFIKQNFPNAIYVSLEDDVVLYDNVRSRIYNRIVTWKEPFTDCEFFNVTTMIDKETTLEVAHNYEEGVPIPGMKFRRLHDNAGDYTLAAWWCGGEITVGPDPNYPFGACLFPWLPKNQMGKKGQCDDLPFGFHCVNFRSDKVGTDYGEKVIIKKFSELNDPDIDVTLLDRVHFPKEVYVDDNRIIQWKE